ncbi:hypothetical protein AA313_de0205677 [Arthrobotrys entomopaga]|nr:hypothetical protein AA313_de0205677 [Arthrobotrys entomopaga]
MLKLRVEASKCLKSKLNLRIGLKEVKFNGKPLKGKSPKGLSRKTIYLWKVKGDLTDEEHSTAKLITESDSDNRDHKIRKWLDKECDILTSMITEGKLVPELYEEDPIVLQRTPPHHDGALDDTSTTNRTETDIWSLEESDDDAHTNMRGEKRPRSPSPELEGFGYDLDDLLFAETSTSYITSEHLSRKPDAVSEHDDIEITTTQDSNPQCQLPITIETHRSEENNQITKRCRIQTTELSENFESGKSVTTAQESTQGTLVPETGQEPRLMALDAAGYLNFSSSVLETPALQPTDNTIAPVAASPTEIRSRSVNDQLRQTPSVQLTSTDETHPSPDFKKHDQQADCTTNKSQNTADLPHTTGGFKEWFSRAIDKFYGDEINHLKEDIASLKTQNDKLSSCLAERDKKIRNLEMDGDTYRSQIVELETNVQVSEAKAQASEAESQRLAGDMKNLAEKDCTLREQNQDLAEKLKRLGKDLEDFQKKETLLLQDNQRQAMSHEMELDEFYQLYKSMKERPRVSLYVSNTSRPDSQHAAGTECGV